MLAMVVLERGEDQRNKNSLHFLLCMMRLTIYERLALTAKAKASSLQSKSFDQNSDLAGCLLGLDLQRPKIQQHSKIREQSRIIFWSIPKTNMNRKHILQTSNHDYFMDFNRSYGGKDAKRPHGCGAGAVRGTFKPFQPPGAYPIICCNSISNAVFSTFIRLRMRPC